MNAEKLAKAVADGVVEWYVGRYYDQHVHSRLSRHGLANMDGGDRDAAMRSASRAKILELGVPYRGGRSVGAKVQFLHRATGEPVPASSWSGEIRPPVDIQVVRYVQIIMPWEDWIDAYHQHITDVEEAAERREEERRLEKARRQEQAAKDWMAREFESARRDIADVRVAVDGPPYVDGYEPDDEDVRKLVEHRNPDGNPYLNGTREAY